MHTKPHIITLAHPRDETKIRNWRIVAGVLLLLLVQAVLGRMDSDARLAEIERLSQMQTRQVVRYEQNKPLRREVASLSNHHARGVL